MQTLPSIYRWTRAEYERLAELDIFQDKRVELIGGQIVEMAAKRPVHSVLTNRVRKALERAFPTESYTVRIHDPLALSEQDAPEPDVAVARGADEDYSTAHPTAEQTVLVVEVADSSVRYDLGDKANVYAAAGIKDYWVVDVQAGQVVVLRAPGPEGYGEHHVYRAGEQITPLSAGARVVAMADLLP